MFNPLLNLMGFEPIIRIALPHRGYKKYTAGEAGVKKVVAESMMLVIRQIKQAFH